MSFISNLFSKAAPVDYKSLLKSGAMIIDVRTSDEYRSGNIKGSVNIPLDQIQRLATDLKKKNVPLITCCKSGNRSGLAKNILQSAGIECYNGGAWDSLNAELKAA